MIESKVAILEELDRNVVSATTLSERYRMEQSRISDIKRKREAFLSSQQKVVDMGMNK